MPELADQLVKSDLKNAQGGTAPVPIETQWPSIRIRFEMHR